MWPTSARRAGFRDAVQIAASTAGDSTSSRTMAVTVSWRAATMDWLRMATPSPRPARSDGAGGAGLECDGGSDTLGGAGPVEQGPDPGALRQAHQWVRVEVRQGDCPSFGQGMSDRHDRDEAFTDDR